MVFASYQEAKDKELLVLYIGLNAFMQSKSLEDKTKSVFVLINEMIND